MDDYDYEYVDDDEATLEMDEIADRFKRSVDHSRQQLTIINLSTRF